MSIPYVRIDDKLIDRAKKIVGIKKADRHNPYFKGVLGAITIEEEYNAIYTGQGHMLLKRQVKARYSTTLTTVEPKPSYACNVLEKVSKKDEFDMFIFIRLLWKKSWPLPGRAYMVGDLSKSRFLEIAIKRPPGKYGKSTYPTSHYHLHINQLDKPAISSGFRKQSKKGLF